VRSPDRTRQLVLLELNEVNFEVARRYVDRLGLKNLGQLLDGRWIRTSSENSYELLEPWIQWVSAHSGLTAAQHGVLRLGDIVGSKVPQMFEQLEAFGLKIGCVSPMNAENRLRSPAYFIPDPWTRTPSDGSFFSRMLTEAVGQAVNDNAQARITAGSKLKLLLALLRFARSKHWRQYAHLFTTNKSAPWRRALFLDLLLHDVHCSLFKSRSPDFSALFLNAGAHVQHHYFLNADLESPRALKNPEWYVAADADPVSEMLRIYDSIVGDYVNDPNIDLIVATGLTQRPYDRVKFYYRLVDHAAFLQAAGVRFKAVYPRMTRDFLIEFDSDAEAADACRTLRSIQVLPGRLPLFGEIDNRGTSTFATMTYPDEITAGTVAILNSGPVALQPLVAFVAIKNGMHDARGYAFFKGDVAVYSPIDGEHVGRLFETVRRYFGMVT
jgi:hypothetical protein